jgi:hypothetical protein
MLAAIIAALSLAVTALAIAAGGGWAVFVRTASRFQKVDEALQAHTVALTQLVGTVAMLTEGQGRLLNNAEELDDAMQAMQISTALHRQRLDEFDDFKRQLERNSPNQPPATRTGGKQ